MDDRPDSLPNSDRVAPICLGWESEPAGLTEVARRRRDEVMDAAEAIIAGQGIDQLSLARIEERAGMSRGQLTYYFPTKESILLAVHERMLRRMIREFLASDGPKPMTGQAWGCFKNALSGHLGLNPVNPIERGKDLFSLLYTFLAQMGHREDYRNRLSEMSRTRQGMIATDFAQSVPEPRQVSPQIAAGLIQALLHGLTVMLMVDQKAFDRREMYEACVQLFAPLFKHDAEQVSEPLISKTNDPGTARA
ncbi:MAG TPA: TetR/AcrR family transcriptional regulator [Gemmata sp.]|nr:TetR/AcrR family transcriptional regulator [Gemmata sp.]